jgi:hypothetical protein
MYTQIIGLNGPQIHIFSHLLKIGGIYFNDVSDQDDFDNYTNNKILTSFYAHIPYHSFELDQPYINELFGFLNNTDKNFATNSIRDIICTQYLLNSPFAGKVIYIDYSFDDLKNYTGELVDKEYFEENKQIIEHFIERCKNSNWNYSEINYNQFVSNKNYRDNSLTQMLINPESLDYLYKKINNESTITRFDDLAEKYINLYIKNYITILQQK